MKLSFLAVVLTFSLNVFAQANELPAREGDEKKSKSLIGDRGLNRFFLDGSIALGLSNGVSYGKHYITWGGTTNFRIGNNFYFGKGLKPVILRLTYLRFGILFANPFGVYAVLPSVGLGKHFDWRNKKANSIEPMLHAGIIASVDDLINSDLEFYPYFSGEVKFNFSKFTFGVELSTKKFEPLVSNDPYHSNYSRGYYFGFSVGARLGKGLRFSN